MWVALLILHFRLVFQARPVGLVVSLIEADVCWGRDGQEYRAVVGEVAGDGSHGSVVFVFVVVLLAHNVQFKVHFVAEGLLHMFNL